MSSKAHLLRRAELPLLLLPILLLFAWLQQNPWLDTVKNLAMDWRFLIRGSLESPVRTVYVNFDEVTNNLFGERFFPRSVYADAGEAIIATGGARALFFDVVFSPITASRAVNVDFIHEQDRSLGEFVQKYGDRVVLAAWYSEQLFSFMDQPSILPLKRHTRTGASGGYDPAFNAYPEAPVYPIWNPIAADQSESRWGRAGLINIDVERSAGPAPRWLPLFTEVANEVHTRYYIASLAENLRRSSPDLDYRVRHDDSSYFLELHMGGESMEILSLPTVIPVTFYTAAIELLLAYHGWNASEAIRQDGDTLEIIDPATGQIAHQIPLQEEQILEINWFAPWDSNTYEVPLPDFGSERNYRRPVEALEHLRSQPEDFTGAERTGILHITLDWLAQRGSDPHNPKISLGEIWSLARLRADPALAPHIDRFLVSFFKDSVVLIGPTDPTMQDVAPTPLDATNVPRVSAHGNLFKTILTDRYLRRLPPLAESLLVVGLGLVAGALVRVQGRFSLLAKAAVGLVLLGYAVIVGWAFARHHLVVPLIMPLAAGIVASMFLFAIQLIREEQHKSRIKGMFGTYVSPEIVNRMVEADEEPRLGGEEASITALFSDIQSFSSFSEILSPVQLVEIMNEYLGAMTDILESENGTLDKYIGDAIVAMFGAPLPLPDHSLRACVTVCRMQEAQARLREKWRSEGAKWPEIVFSMRTRIGLNSGLATVGNMGSLKRFNYTFMGDTVNLAARCESGAKSAGCYSLVGEATRREAEKCGDAVIFRFIDRWQVKGRRQPVEMHEILGLKGQVSDQLLECKAAYETALQAYFQQDWDRAEAFLRQSLPLEPFNPAKIPESPTCPSQVLLQRLAILRADPPGPNWDGVYVMRSK